MQHILQQPRDAAGQLARGCAGVFPENGGGSASHWKYRHREEIVAMFIFPVSEIISYGEYTNFLSQIKFGFDEKKRKLFDTWHITSQARWENNTEEDYIVFRSQYRSLRQNVISDVLKQFRSCLPTNCLIYEFGSLVKQTDRIESDIDLTICYDEKKLQIYESVEELINYSIVSVFENPIDHIHGKFQHYPICHDYDLLTEADNCYRLEFADGAIEYQCGPDALAENIMNIKNVRDYFSLLAGYREKYELQCNIDCLYSIQILENTTNHNFLGDLASLEAKNDIFSAYRYVPRTYCLECDVEIAWIKKALKDTVVTMYIMIAFLRKRLPWLEEYSMTMENVFHSEVLKDLLGEEYICGLRTALVKMIFYWDKIELVLKKKGVMLSTRCHSVYSRQELDTLMEQAYGERNMMDKLMGSIQNLNEMITEGWRRLNERFG